MIDKSIHPVYNLWCDFPAWPKNDILIVSVWSFNTFTQNDFLGQVQFEYPTDPTGKTIVNQPLRPDSRTTEVSGTIQLMIYDLEKHKAYVQKQKEQKQTGTAAVDSATAALVTRMKNGDPWLYYDVKQARECLLWYLPSTSGGMGYIVWTQRVGGSPQAVMSSRHTLALSTLKKMCVGDACSHASYTPNPDWCLELIGNRVTHNLLADSHQQLDDWLAGIKSLLETSGKSVKNQADAPSAPLDSKGIPSPAESDTAKKKVRRMTVEPNEKPRLHEQPKTLAAVAEKQPSQAAYSGIVNAAVQMMITGVDTLQYTINGAGNVQCSTIRLVFIKTGGKYGALCWTESGQAKKLPLHECTDIYVGKKTGYF